MNFIHQITQSVNSQLSHLLENNSHNTMLEQYYSICSMRLCDEYLLTQLRANDPNLLKRIWQIAERDKILQQLAITFHLSKTEIFSLLNEATPVLYTSLQQQANDQGLELYQLLLNNHDEIRRLLPMWVGDIIPQAVLNGESTSAPTSSKVGMPAKTHTQATEQQAKHSQAQQATISTDKQRSVNDNPAHSRVVSNVQSAYVENRSTAQPRLPRSSGRVPAYRSANNDNGSKKLLWLVAIVGIVLVLIWGLLWFLVAGNKDKSKDNAQKPEVKVEQQQASKDKSPEPAKPLEAPMEAKEEVTETDPTVTSEESTEQTATTQEAQSETVTEQQPSQQQSQTFVPTNGNELQQQLGYGNQTAQQPMPQEQAQPQSQPMSQPMFQPMPQQSQPMPQQSINNNRSNAPTNNSNVVYYDSEGNPISGGSASISIPNNNTNSTNQNLSQPMDNSFSGGSANVSIPDNSTNSTNQNLSQPMDNSFNQQIYSDREGSSPNPQ